MHFFQTDNIDKMDNFECDKNLLDSDINEVYIKEEELEFSDPIGFENDCGGDSPEQEDQSDCGGDSPEQDCGGDSLGLEDQVTQF